MTQTCVRPREHPGRLLPREAQAFQSVESPSSGDRDSLRNWFRVHLAVTRLGCLARSAKGLGFS